jgi:uncharacterized protein (TIGR02145 family)
LNLPVQHSKLVFESLTLLALSLLSACTDKEPPPIPVIKVTVSPVSGNTTHTFTFDLSKSESKTNRGAKVFTRWDWDGNGIWDTPFTHLLVYEHRYHTAGTWKPAMEMSNMNGLSDTMSFVLQVMQGYSPPNPAFKIIPAAGHIYTRFLLDASGTRDDEDSLDQLTFRWDFEGDGQWDTQFGDSVKISLVYPVEGFYQPKFQAKDPSGLISSATADLLINLVDKRLVMGFRCIPDSVTHNTPIIMDASATKDLDFPDKPMQYRWDWNNDRLWDTEWLSDPVTSHVFREEFFNPVHLQVRSFRGLTNDTVIRIRVYHRNQVPRAFFTVNTVAGNINTKFRLDCWPTRDVESSPAQLQYRWDFDGDGIWDTDFSDQVVVIQQFENPGTYKTTVEVKDPLGERDTCSKMIYVSRGSNETGTYLDKRGAGWEYYGTVKIGDQWWFTRNVCVHDTLNYFQFFYDNSWPLYYDYGNLYLLDYTSRICPDGWRVPSKNDWDNLFSNYPEEVLFDALMPGGESDFGATLGGMGTGRKADIAVYQNIDQNGHYWSTSKPLFGDSPSIWTIEFDRHNRTVLKGFVTATGKLFSVRCIKDAD